MCHHEDWSVERVAETEDEPAVEDESAADAADELAEPDVLADGGEDAD